MYNPEDRKDPELGEGWTLGSSPSKGKIGTGRGPRTGPRPQADRIKI